MNGRVHSNEHDFVIVVVGLSRACTHGILCAAVFQSTTLYFKLGFVGRCRWESECAGALSMATPSASSRVATSSASSRGVDSTKLLY